MNTLARLTLRSAAALTLGAAVVLAPAASADHHGAHGNPLVVANPFDDTPAASAPSAGYGTQADNHDHSSPGGDHKDHGDAKAHGDKGYGDADHADHGDGHEKPQLISPKVSEMIWTLVIFGIFFAVLATVVWPKILGALQAREDKQRSDLKTAEEAAAKATASIAEYDAKIAEARKEAASIVAEARTAAQQAANADKAKIESEVAAMKAAAKADIASAKEQALTDIYAQTASLSTAVAGKILQREINADDQQQLINDSLAQFKNSQG